MVMEEQQSDMELDSERVPVPRVQKSTEDSRAEIVNKITSIPRGKPRLRKKALHAAILKQMEFYFSDPNLSKDRFLSNLIKDDPYVDLSVFITFNKIRELTTDINRITKALQASTMLALSEDGTKVRRITQIIRKENTDECTVYIQNLPPDADHEMLSSILSQYGPVAYVSVPRYHHNRKIKGFAFVEFDTPETAKNCLKAFKKKGCVLPSHTTPDELLSITTFNDAEKGAMPTEKTVNSDVTSTSVKIEDTEESEAMETDKDRSVENNEEKEEATMNNSSELHESKNKKKIKRKRQRDSEVSESGDPENQIDTEVVKSKKKKFKQSVNAQNNETEESTEEQAEFVPLEVSPKKKSKKSVSVSEEPVFDGGENEKMITEDNAVAITEDEENARDKKKKRRRKRRSKTEDVSYSLGLQVMAKKDWKHLRNKYLELQRSKMKQLKQHLWKTRWNQRSNYERNRPEKEGNDEKEKTCKEEKTSTVRFSFVPGVIVKVEMDKPCSDPKGLKVELKMNSSVKYIDIKEGSSLAYVRCDTAEAAQTFAQKSDEERHMTLLDGDEEKAYWGKIERDREEKLGKKVRPKQRGRNKLLKKAETVLGKHIKFDEV
ncbi:la related protein 7 [Andrena cerasifolii]|uniref:la related protein 7 n=1 Tax=Andrena cerasifolii TaxID=2819439 RepID=UPI0040381E2F